MRIPRDVSGADLARKLKSFGYQITRQTGSHMRLTTQEQGEHHVTVPNHDPVRLGTLNDILTEVAAHFQIERDEILRRLFE